jgi:hypothetical protein
MNGNQKATWDAYVKAIDRAMATGRYASRFEAGAHIQRRDPAMRAAALAGPDTSTGTPSGPRRDLMSRAVDRLCGEQAPEREPVDEAAIAPLDRAVLRLLEAQTQEQARQQGGALDRAMEKFLSDQVGSGGRG